MSTLLYYLPGTADLPPDTQDRRRLLEASGLGYLLEAPKVLELWNKTTLGPDSRAGVFFTYEPSPVTGAERCKLAVRDGEQDWMDCGKFWIGRWKLALPSCLVPKPEDLQRERLYASYWPLLADDQRWAVPTVPADLPQVYAVRSDGTEHWPVQKDFLDMLPLAKRYFDIELLARPIQQELVRLGELLQSAADPETKAGAIKESDDLQKKLNGLWPGSSELERQTKAARDITLVLSKNYYVSKWEVACLGLLDKVSIARVIRCCIMDYEAVEMQDRAEKKSGEILPAIDSTKSGVPIPSNSPLTSPLVPISSGA